MAKDRGVRSRRGRPRSKAKAIREKNSSAHTIAITKQYEGFYTSLWAAFREGKSGFATWCTNWSASQTTQKHGPLCNIIGEKSVYELISQLCASNSEKWFCVTRKQFMFQIADVCIILHSLNGLIQELNSDTLTCDQLRAIVCSSSQFVRWCGRQTRRHGDILACGDESDLNFRRIMQHGVCFHSHHRLDSYRSDKTKRQLQTDMRCFSDRFAWTSDLVLDVHVNAQNHSLRFECAPFHVTVRTETHLEDCGALIDEHFHMALSMLDPVAKGKVVKHVIGRMKTLIGHNSTISPHVVMMLNPTLTQDKRKRAIGIGPAKWSALWRNDPTAAKMKAARKNNKAALCQRLNKSKLGAPGLIWPMFAAWVTLRVHTTTPCMGGGGSGVRTQVRKVRTPICDIHQDSQFYCYMDDLLRLKTNVFEAHAAAFESCGLQFECAQTLYTLDIVESQYSGLLKAVLLAAESVQSSVTKWLSAQTIQLGFGMTLACSGDVHEMMHIYKYMHLPCISFSKITRPKPCSMKDPDKFGFSWVRTSARRRIATPVPPVMVSKGDSGVKCARCGTSPPVCPVCESATGSISCFACALAQFATGHGLLVHPDFLLPAHYAFCKNTAVFAAKGSACSFIPCPALGDGDIDVAPQQRKRTENGQNALVCVEHIVLTDTISLADDGVSIEYTTCGDLAKQKCLLWCSTHEHPRAGNVIFEDPVSGHCVQRRLDLVNAIKERKTIYVRKHCNVLEAQAMDSDGIRQVYDAWCSRVHTSEHLLGVLSTPAFSVKHALATFCLLNTAKYGIKETHFLGPAREEGDEITDFDDLDLDGFLSDIMGDDSTAWEDNFGLE